MDEHGTPDKATAPRRAIVAAAVACAIFGSGCAGAASSARDERLEATKARVEEVERINGRLTVRIEELEDQVFLLQDRVQSHRIALERRGMSAHAARRPQAAPETYYYAPDEGYDERPRTYKPKRKVTRIPLNRKRRRAEPAPRHDERAEAAPSESPQEEEVVITDDQFEKFVKDYGTSDAPAPKASAPSAKKPKHAPVTDERIETTTPSKTPDPSSAAGQGAKGDSAPSSTFVVRGGLDTYRDALAAYRAGRYADALFGFEAFLRAKPKADYVDNALYWIGECQFGLGRYGKARSSFQKVVRDHPRGNKVPDALLKMSLALERLGEHARATKTLERLSREFPTTHAGRLGARKLAERSK